MAIIKIPLKPSDGSLHALRRQLSAWDDHIERLKLTHRREFRAWLAQSLSASEFALLVDAEVDRRSLWETYLREKFGISPR